MKISILSVGKIKEPYLKDAIAEYTKRLNRYCKLEIIEVADEKAPENASPAEKEAILEKEASRLQKHLKEDAYTITLEIEGSQLSSEELAQKIDTLATHGKSHLQFVIGGSLGLAKSITSHADYSLSFSRFTFPHQLMRVILLEQIYRSYKIISGEPYHK